MDGPAGWLQVVSNLGVPLALLTWYMFAERPRQLRREEEQQRRWEENIKQALKDQRADFETTRARDRENALEIAKLTSEIHAATTKELSEAVKLNVGIGRELIRKYDELIGRLDGVICKFRDN